MDSLTTPPPVRELPRVRRFTTLPEVQSAQIDLPVLAKKPKEKKTRIISFGLILIGIMLFSALGLALFTINRLDQSNKEYEALYKRVYQISLSQKQRIARLEDEMMMLTRIKDRLALSRRQVINGYRRLAVRYQEQKNQYLALKNKEKGYQRLLAAKTVQAGVIQGSLNLASTQVEALAVQQKILRAQINEQTARVRELTSKLLANINKRKLLLRENLVLRQQLEQKNQQVVKTNK